MFMIGKIQEKSKYELKRNIPTCKQNNHLMPVTFKTLKNWLTIICTRTLNQPKVTNLEVTVSYQSVKTVQKKSAGCCQE